MPKISRRKTRTRSGSIRRPQPIGAERRIRCRACSIRRQMKQFLPFLLGTLLHWSMLAVAGDTEQVPGPDLPTREISVAGRSFHVELAVTPAEKARGLMYRETLPEGSGMLFRVDPPATVSFWMKDVRFPLDLLYLDGRGCLLGHHDNVPPCTSIPCPIYSSARPASWVLELPAGTREGLGLTDRECAINLAP